MSSRGRLGLFTVVVVSLAALPANAVPATIVNPSFEALTGGDPVHFDAQGRLRPGHFSVAEQPNNPNGFLSVDAVPGWDINGYGGTMAPVLGAGGAFAALSGGQNTLFFNELSFAHQMLPIKYQASTRYRLRVDIGRPANIETFSGYQIGFGAGLQLHVSDSTSVTLAPGEFKTAELAYTVAPGDPLIGQTVTIMLFGLGAPQTHYDNVRLDLEPLDLPQASIARAVEISWPSRVNEFYRVERATRVENPDWTPITGTLTGTGARMAIFDVAADQARYYRLVPVAQP